MPSLNRYKIIESDIQQLNQQPFSSILPYQSIAEKYLKLLYDDQKVLYNLNNIFKVQINFKQEMTETFTFLRSI